MLLQLSKLVVRSSRNIVGDSRLREKGARACCGGTAIDLDILEAWKDLPTVARSLYLIALCVLLRP